MKLKARFDRSEQLTALSNRLEALIPETAEAHPEYKWLSKSDNFFVESAQESYGECLRMSDAELIALYVTHRLKGGE